MVDWFLCLGKENLLRNHICLCCDIYLHLTEFSFLIMIGVTPKPFTTIALAYFIFSVHSSHDWKICLQDFYIDDHWNRLPVSWKSALEIAEPEILTDLFKQSSDASSDQIVWPLSLLCLRSLIRKLSISRYSQSFDGEVSWMFVLSDHKLIFQSIRNYCCWNQCAITIQSWKLYSGNESNRKSNTKSSEWQRYVQQQQPNAKSNTYWILAQV